MSRNASNADARTFFLNIFTFGKPLALGVALSAVLGGAALAQEWTLDQKQLVEQPKSYSPFVDQYFPQNVYFGDTHFHSSLSIDSGMIGNVLDLNTAIRFARGQEVVSSSGQRTKLNRPLDFMVLSDHAEYLGIASLLSTADPELLATEVGQEWFAVMREGGDAAWALVLTMLDDFGSGTPSFRDAKIECELALNHKTADSMILVC